MHIVKLVAENVKCLHAVVIKPDGNLVQITGPNGAGKSAVLDSVAYGFRGKRMEPPEPIRRGADYMRVMLDLGEIVINRRQDVDGTQHLTINRADGTRIPTPGGRQTFLDELYEETAFDPQAFSRMLPKDQAATLMRAVGLNFDELDAKRAGFFDNRRDVRRNLKALTAQRDGIPEVDSPDEEVSVATLSEQLTEALETQNRNDQCRLEAERGLQEYESAECALREAEQHLELAKQTVADAAEDVRARNKVIDTLVDPDIAATKQRIADAEGVNRRVRQKKQRQALTDDVNAVKATDESLTVQIDQINTEKAQALAEATMPVDGLSIEDGHVMMHALPFEQAASSDILIASAAIGIALKPKARIALNRDGSLLDDKNLARLAEWCDTEDVQVFIECVGDDASVGVHIVDGRVSGAEPVEESKAT